MSHLLRAFHVVLVLALLAVVGCSSPAAGGGCADCKGCSGGSSACRGCGGCGSRQPQPAASATLPTNASNALCPVMGMAVDPSLPTSVYEGRVIGFCCGCCKAKFDADPDAYTKIR